MAASWTLFTVLVFVVPRCWSSTGLWLLDSANAPQPPGSVVVDFTVDGRHLRYAFSATSSDDDLRLFAATITRTLGLEAGGGCAEAGCVQDHVMAALKARAAAQDEAEPVADDGFQALLRREGMSKRQISLMQDIVSLNNSPPG